MVSEFFKIKPPLSRRNHRRKSHTLSTQTATHLSYPNCRTLSHQAPYSNSHLIATPTTQMSIL
ncbi:hypothetical protein EPI10_020273 [Gossypium australe]|uniref:Uncharacterized protein n=1 Tax=Gossypium australe TaxID=47621 RepID=A0A5B6WDS7_9ROSI|nr:hypothetical protein EPI10_020273 [Gossypium australe]